MTKKNHPFHLVEISPWPLIGSLGALTLVSGLVKWFHFMNNNLMFLGMLILMFIMIQWWRDISLESTFQGLHPLKVSAGLQWGMILFITSEIMFFLSFFWGFFHSSLSPSMDLGFLWPPKEISPFNPLEVPLLNTLILLSSGITVTATHHSLMVGNSKQAFMMLTFTITLGLYFSILQAYEYFEAPFTLATSVYGSSFFVATGFHGMHVLIGTTFLGVCLYRHLLGHFSPIHHFGFEAAAWYWHFVDVVWLFLYLSVYWWGK
uniref:Cytochrome c oxidase subunit 3 n=1 Tax=Elateroidea sp. BMNH 1274729 TaxID=1796501 RepID=A0A126TGH0_9COLE|nr:cytochrome c oxidase subunit III [Elateroidea sp. BMNH 1274729]